MLKQFQENIKDRKQLLYGVILGVLLLGVCVFLIMNDAKVKEKALKIERKEGIIKEAGELELTNSIPNTLKNLGLSGMNITGFKVNDNSISTKGIDTPQLYLNSTLEKVVSEWGSGGDVLKQNIFINNKLTLEQLINFLIIIQIDYDKITWNSTDYDLNKYAQDNPLKLICWYSNNSKNELNCPNIFMDDKFMKRINYKDIGLLGGMQLPTKMGVILLLS